MIPTIAFIAKYAPKQGSTAPVYAIDENIVYSKYHYDVYAILNRHFPNLCTGNDASFLMKHHKNIDYVFSLLNRAPYRNSEIFISSLAEYYGIPYLGTRPNIRALAEDKHLAKVMAEHCEIKTPRWAISNVGDQCDDEEPFRGPYFVKPRYGASSKLIDESSICPTWEDVKIKISELHTYGEDTIIETFADGMYYSSPVIFRQGKPIVLPPVREQSTLKGNVVTYYQKRKVALGLTRYVETNQEIINLIERASKSIANFIRPADYIRIDYILSQNGLEFIEFNVCCNLGMQSSFALSAKAFGMSYEQLIMSILNESLTRQGVM